MSEQTNNPQVRIKTNYGSMVVKLYPEKAPGTVENFLRYVEGGFYDGTLFHRTIANFVIQGGGMERGLYLKDNISKPIENEAANGLKNRKYTIAMARTADVHSATCQFFINVADNHFLDYTEPTEEGWGYCVFGRLTAGCNVATVISEVRTETRMNYSDVPCNDVVIETVALVEADSDDDAEESGDDVAGEEQSA